MKEYPGCRLQYCVRRNTLVPSFNKFHTVDTRVKDSIYGHSYISVRNLYLSYSIHESLSFETTRVTPVENVYLILRRRIFYSPVNVFRKNDESRLDTRNTKIYRQ